MRWFKRCTAGVVVRAIRMCAVCMTLALPTQAHADDSSPKREVPDYDGRGPDPSRSDGAGVWTARVLLSPLYFTSEYLLRRPIGALLVAAERADLPRKLYDFFVFGPNHTIGFIPVGYVEFGFNPSVGVYGFWNDALTPRNAFTLHYEVWPDQSPSDWLAGSMNDQYRLDKGSDASVPSQRASST